jgi:hypothetical protein
MFFLAVVHREDPEHAEAGVRVGLCPGEPIHIFFFSSIFSISALIAAT